MTLALGPFQRPFNWRWLSEGIWRVEHAFERAKAEGRPADDVRVRVVFILALFAAGFIALSIGAVKTAMFPDSTRVGSLAGLPPGSRADLVDRNGQLLALDLPFYNVYVDRRVIWDADETRRRLAPFLGADGRARLDMALNSRKRTKLIGPLSPELKAAIDEMGLPGISFETEARRDYPLGATAAHLIGYAGSGGVGLSGAEMALDKSVRDSAGRAPVQLSMDLRVQAALEDELQKAVSNSNAQGAVGIVTNIRTGEVLAIASLPDASPEKLANSGENIQRNRAWQSVYEMGSTFKIYSVAIGLDSGKVNMNTAFDVATPLVLPGQIIHDFHGSKNSLTLSEVFTHSSNIGTAKLAIEDGRDLVTKYFKDFGLFGAAPVELQGSARPLLPAKPEKWTPNMVATTAFGHSISVSPLTMAAGVGGIMNDGVYVPLTIQKRDAPPANGTRRIVSEQTSRQMLELMRKNAVEGTGKKANLNAPGLRVGGKTGTADKINAQGRYGGAGVVASFASVFPTDAAPGADKYFVLVLVDDPRSTALSPGQPSGASVSAPIAGRIINRIAPFLKVARVAAPVQTPVAVAPEAEEAEH
jgi:cell division protein FtsI (penicillin-binding protein 3)